MRTKEYSGRPEVKVRDRATNRKYYWSHREEILKRCMERRTCTPEAKLRNRNYTKRYNLCVKNLFCPGPGKLGAKFIVFSCEVCGKDFRRSEKIVDSNYKNRGCLPRFCSVDCRNFANRKNYQSPYAKKIKRLLKQESK